MAANNIVIRDGNGNLINIRTEYDPASNTHVNYNVSETQLQYREGGFISANTNASNGAAFVSFSNVECKQLMIVCTSAVDLIQDGNANNRFFVPAQTVLPISGILNANQISFRRNDQSNTSVTVNARWER